MNDPSSIIEHSERLTSAFGRWPSFHDAEIVEVRLSLGDAPHAHPSPTLTIKVHVWGYPGELGSRRYAIQAHHVITTLRFHDVDEDLSIVGFLHQNVLHDLYVKQQERPESQPRVLGVDFPSIVGMSVTFTCRRAEVIDAMPCDKAGIPIDP